MIDNLLSLIRNLKEFNSDDMFLNLKSEFPNKSDAEIWSMIISKFTELGVFEITQYKILCNEYKANKQRKERADNEIKQMLFSLMYEGILSDAGIQKETLVETMNRHFIENYKTITNTDGKSKGGLKL